MCVLYLLRLAETGREAQPKRSKLRRDVVDAVRAAMPNARIRARVGRVLVDAPEPVRRLADIHGVASLSPCRCCSLAELEATVLDMARLNDVGSFCVRVKRVGNQSFTSQQLAASLGAALKQRYPSRSVDLERPDAVIGVEVRGDECYVYDEIIPGADRRDGHVVAVRDRSRLLVDHMLGKLKVSLRLLGFDTAYARHEPDSAVVRRARKEQRVIITRDLELSQARTITAVYVTASDPSEQLTQVVSALGLEPKLENLFSRCSLCNRRVDKVTKEQIRRRIPDVVYRTYDEFTCCPSCDKVYWKGEQYDELLGRFGPLLAG